jgi:hypothetical protein
VIAAGLLAVFTPLIVIALPAAGLMVLVINRRWGITGSVVGAAAGLGAGPLVVAYLNRQGPGTVCHAVGGSGTSCTDEFSPWPWLAAGVLLVAAAVGVHVALRRTARRNQVGTGTPLR